ncbi:cystatin-like fold lipoprotein [Staphylococcus aureus]|uniref:cystatin-like fold lipoprotein n=1 Tax=Staphylococcus aureus TaxID=1280 RepID=UPI0029BFBF3B|nr:cystatin-like fold lipoprotein [Staphylococcus aureus]WPF96928.1 cystatin-like fold lipoprotein [Staphylococcus aureus]WPF98890.1 cystatin-like fold lipoprotein [Staphylococcus aureus]
MKKRFLFSAFILVLSIALVACGKNYDKEIEEVSKLHADSWNSDMSGDAKKFDEATTNFYVYEEGMVIILVYRPIKNSDFLSYRLYRKNETTGKYEEDYKTKPKRFMKENKPDYKEENLKE